MACIDRVEESPPKTGSSRLLDQEDQNVRLDQQDFIELGTLFQDTEFSTLRKTPQDGVKLAIWVALRILEK